MDSPISLLRMDSEIFFIRASTGSHAVLFSKPSI